MYTAVDTATSEDGRPAREGGSTTAATPKRVTSRGSESSSWRKRKRTAQDLTAAVSATRNSDGKSGRGSKGGRAEALTQSYVLVCV